MNKFFCFNKNDFTFHCEKITKNQTVIKLNETELTKFDTKNNTEIKDNKSKEVYLPSLHLIISPHLLVIEKNIKNCHCFIKNRKIICNFALKFSLHAHIIYI